ncbi:MAG: hypothetical protein FRX49_06948 [Trebouxia sp. A1-2]|nr:MAG: hypothetical protein FRX49_06948 [Trebouxia sp. A1-2]
MVSLPHPFKLRRKLPRSIQFQGLSVSISVSRSLQNKHEQRKAKAADTSGKQARRKAKKVKRQASKQQSGQRQASPPQLARSGVASTQPAMEQQGLVPDDEPLLTAIFPLPGGITSLPIVEGPPAALARLHPAPSSGALSTLRQMMKVQTWFEPEQRPRKRVPKQSVHGEQSPQGASKTFLAPRRPAMMARPVMS